MPKLRNIHKSFDNVQVLDRVEQIFAFGNVLVHSPKLALLDDPFAEIDTIAYDCKIANRLTGGNYE